MDPFLGNEYSSFDKGRFFSALGMKMHEEKGLLVPSVPRRHPHGLSY